MTESIMNGGQSDRTNDECAAFQASMADLIGDGEDLHEQPHMATCERCRALVLELQAIADAARDLFPPDLEPDEELWNKIESKLGLAEPEEEAENAALTGEDAGGELALDSGIGSGGLALEGGIA